MSSVKLQGQLEEVVKERTKLVISILLNSSENQVAKSFELFDVHCMYLQAEKTPYSLSLGCLFSGKVLRQFLEWQIRQ